ncbi:hypothetical protein KKA53_02035 [Candidatus Dependentiae bacterium]|nr:hypothetical protein [Candidatus Dependentiae bacterium]
MREPILYQKNIVTARLKRALFFVQIIFLSGTCFANFDRYMTAITQANWTGSVLCTNNLRSFMREGHETLGSPGWAQSQSCHTNSHKQHEFKTPQSLLVKNHINPSIFLELQNVAYRNMPTVLKNKLPSKLVEMKQLLQKFFDKFDSCEEFRKHASQFLRGWNLQIEKSRQEKSVWSSQKNSRTQALCRPCIQSRLRSNKKYKNLFDNSL